MKLETIEEAVKLKEVWIVDTTKVYDISLYHVDIEAELKEYTDITRKEALDYYYESEEIKYSPGYPCDTSGDLTFYFSTEEEALAKFDELQKEFAPKLKALYEDWGNPDGSGECEHCGQEKEFEADFSGANWTKGGSISNWDDCMDNGTYVCTNEDCYESREY